MRIKEIVVLFCICVFSLSSYAQNKETKKAALEWEKLVLLQTKKAEVENYFGKPILESGYMSSYDTDFGRIHIWYYGDKKSNKNLPYKCTVSSDTIYGYRISLTKRIPISATEWNLNKFEKTAGDDGMYIYSYLEKGISFNVITLEGWKEEILTIAYESSFTDLEKKCVKKNKTK